METTMITRSTIRGFATSLATVTLLFAATSAVDAAHRAPMHGAARFASIRVAHFAPPQGSRLGQELE
jgi:hypothetical protein